MARTRHHGRNDDAAPADLAGEEFAAVPITTEPVEATAAPAKSVAAPSTTRWLVTVPGCHPGDLVIEAATELEAVEAYKAKLGIQQLPVPAVVTPAPDDAPAPE